MAMVTLPGKMIIAPWGSGAPLSGIGTALGTAVTMAFNGAGDKVAIIFTAESTTVPDLISFYISGAGTPGTAGDIEATLENVTNGDPSGAVTNSATGSDTFSTTGAKTISGMAGTATITAGNQYAVVLTAGSGWDRNLTIRVSIGSSTDQSYPLVKTKDSAGAWTAVVDQNCGWCFGLADSGGTYINQTGFMGAYDVNLQAFSSSTNPDERGNRFSFPAPVRICGAAVLWTGGSTPGANDDVRVKLLSSHTATPVERLGITLEGESTGASCPHLVMFGSTYVCAANTVYALTMEALGSETQSMPRWDYLSNSHLGNVLGTSFYATTRNDLGNCTDDNDSIYGIFPIIDQIDDGTGGGGGGGGLASNPISGFVGR